MYPVEVRVIFQNMTDPLVKNLVKLTPLLIELVMNYHNRNPMEGNKLDSVHP